MDLLRPFVIRISQNKYLIVVVGYLITWIEEEALAWITTQNILHFFKRNILARFNVPQAIITDNGTQFTDQKFQEFISNLGTIQHFVAVEHPQMNKQAEAANRVILRGLKWRLDETKKRWVEELHNMLWGYQTTSHSSTRETHFWLIYGTEVVIPVEIREPFIQTEAPLDIEMNGEALQEELDLVKEIYIGEDLRETSIKQKIALRYDARVITWIRSREHHP